MPRTIDIRRARDVCQLCKKEKETTRTRRFPNLGYSGPCGDSFCYGSCNIDACVTREFTVVACDECAEQARTTHARSKP